MTTKDILIIMGPFFALLIVFFIGYVWGEHKGVHKGWNEHKNRSAAK